MGTNFTGITFDDCNVSPSDDGIINRTILPDGILSGCEISYSGSTLTMAAGTLIACGRQFRHPAAQNWAVVDATTGYARLLITLDLTRSATDQTFDQVVDAVEYANDISGFPALIQQDLNTTGTKYQIVACVVSLGTGGISGIINTMPTVHPASADGGTLTVTAPGGSTVTVSKDGKTLSRVAGAGGVVVFRGLETGTWTLSITDGSQTASKPVDIVADYATSITYFQATIHITYPAGSVCTVTDGKTTLPAPDTSGTWDCVVPNAGAWTVKITDGSRERSESVSITAYGQSVELEILYRTYLYRDGTFYNGTELVKTWSHNDNLWSITYNADRISFWAKGQYGSQTGSVYTRFSDIVDLSKATRVVVKLFAKSTFVIYEDDENRSPLRLRINGGSGWGDNTLARTYMTNLTQNTWYTLAIDVSAIDSAYVNLLLSPGGTGDADFDVTEVYWE